MLGKLMKYDLRSGIRTFSLIWIGLALLGAINGLTIRFVLAGDTQSGLVSFVFGVLPMILLVALYVAMGIFVLVFIIIKASVSLRIIIELRPLVWSR